MALAIDVSLLGLSRALRRMRQVLIRPMALSTGHRRRECARLTDFCSGVRSFPRPSPVGHGGDVARSLVGLVGQGGNAETDTGRDDPVPAGRGEITDPARERGRDPHQASVRCRDDLQVYPVAAVFSRVVPAAVTDPVALGESPVERDIPGTRLGVLTYVALARLS